MRADQLVVVPAVDGWRWRYVAFNGHVLAVSSEAYVRRTDAVRAARRVIGHRPRLVRMRIGDVP